LRNGGRSVLKKTSVRRQRGKSEWDPVVSQLAFIYEANPTVCAQIAGSDSRNGKGQGSVEGGSQQKHGLGSGKATLRKGGGSVLKRTSGRRKTGKSEWDPVGSQLAFICEANSTFYAQFSGSDSGIGKGEGSLEGGSQQKNRQGSWDGGKRWEDFLRWRELELMGGKVRQR
jgi:hypothetical protein